MERQTVAAIERLMVEFRVNGTNKSACVLRLYIKNGYLWGLTGVAFWANTKANKS